MATLSMIWSFVHPSAMLTVPELTASCAAAKVGEEVKPPANRPADIPGGKERKFAQIAARANPVDATTMERRKYFRPSCLNTATNPGPA